MTTAQYSTLNDQGVMEPVDTVARYPSNEQRVYRFENGYGASVIRGPYTYGGPEGCWELGVIEWTEEDGDDEWHLTYDTPVTEDVLGWLTESAVQNYLREISALVRP